MSYTLSSEEDWGSSPTIRLQFTYDRTRGSGSDFSTQYYNIHVTLLPFTYPLSSYGYGITATIYLDGNNYGTFRIKDSSPSQWSTITVSTGNLGITKTTNGATTAITIQMYGEGGRGPTNFNYVMDTDTYMTAPTAPTSISFNKSIAVPSGTVTLTFGGASEGTGNSIVDYHIYYSTDGSNYSGYVATGITGTGTKTYTMTVPSTRGQLYYFKMYSIGSGGLNSSISAVTATLKINTLPSAPTVVNNKPKFDSTTASSFYPSFTITPGSSQDSGQYIRWEVWKDSSCLYTGSYVSTPAASTINFSSPNSITSTTTYKIYTFDTEEYSSYVSVTVYVVKPPVINSVSYTPTVLSGNNNTVSSTDTTQIPLVELISSFSASITPGDTDSISSYSWRARYSDTYGGTTTSLVIGTTSTISSYNFFNSTFLRGKYIILDLTVTDSLYGNSVTKSNFYNFQCPFNGSGISITNILNNNTKTSNIETTDSTGNIYYNTSLYVTYPAKTIEKGYLNISKINLYYSVSGSQTLTSISCQNSDSTITFSPPTTLTDPFTVGIRTTYSDGSYFDVQYGSLTYKKIDTLSFPSGSIFSVSPSQLKPYTSGSSFIMTIPMISDTSIRTKNIYYDFYINSEDNAFTGRINLLTSEISGSFLTRSYNSSTLAYTETINSTFNTSYPTSESISGDNIIVTISSTKITDLFKKLFASAGINNNYSVSYVLIASDDFGQLSNEVSCSSNSINFIEAPTWNTGSIISIGIDYGIRQSGSNDFTYGKKNITVSGSTITDNYLNPKEKAVIYFPLATDYNDDIIKYRLYIYEFDSAQSGDLGTTTNIKEFSCTDKTVVPSGTYDYTTEVIYDTAGTPTHGYILVDGTNYSSETYIYFKLSAIDSKGNETESKIGTSTTSTSNYYLLGNCVLNPSIIIKDSTLSNKSLTLNCDINYSGNISDFNNIKRNVTGIGTNSCSFSGSSFYKIECSTDSTFPTTEVTYSKTFIANDSYLNTFTVDLGSSYSNYKLFIRVSIFNAVYPKSTVTSGTDYSKTIDVTDSSTYDTDGISSIFILYVDEPTVSYRHSHLGINKKEVDGEDSGCSQDILTIANTDTRKLIRFMGVDASVKTRILVIDVDNSTIESSIIDCGTYDSSVGNLIIP
jgi:hypothetical protein